MHFLENKLPKAQHLATVYAVITTIIYTWTMFQYIWRVGSWFNFSSASEMFAIFAYAMTANLVESLFVLALVVIVFFLLPASWTREQWVTKSFLFVVIGLGFIMYRNYVYLPDKVFYELPSTQLSYLLAVEGLILAAPFNKFPALCKIIENLADRFIIFLYLTTPITLISLIVVIYRNLF